MPEVATQSDYGSDDPIWIDNAWLDTVVVVGLTCFILCLMNLSKVRVCYHLVGDLIFLKFLVVSNIVGSEIVSFYFLGVDVQDGDDLWHYWYGIVNCWVLGG
jgi:hypothetical protein